MSYLVQCWDRPRRADGSEPDTGAANALRFETESEAAAYALELFGRWFSLDHYEVRPSADAVNYVWDAAAGRARPLEAAR